MREYTQTTDHQAAFTVKRANTLVQEEVSDPTALLTGEALSLLFAQNGRAAERRELRVMRVRERQEQSERVRERHRR